MGDNMGIETISLIAAVGTTAFSAINTMTQAKQQAKATVQEANLNMKNKARETALKAASVKTSFLNSGLTLDGTPASSIDDVFNVGLADIDLLRTNANRASKNIMSSARMSVLSDVMKTASQAAGSYASSSSSIRDIGTPDQSWDFGDNFSAGARSDYAYAQKGGYGPYRF